MSASSQAKPDYTKKIADDAGDVEKLTSKGKRDYRRFLRIFLASPMARAGLPLPSVNCCLVLGLLERHEGAPVSHDEIQAYMESLGLTYVRQARHLACQGWDLVTGSSRTQNMTYDSAFRVGELALRSLRPNKITTANRKGYVSAKNWAAIKAHFGGCADCGRQQAHYDKGHLDRSKPPVLDNIVPLCTSCNNWYQQGNHDAVLTKDGMRVKPKLHHSNQQTRRWARTVHEVFKKLPNKTSPEAKKIKALLVEMNAAAPQVLRSSRAA